MNSEWARGEAKFENGRIWVDPVAVGTPGREVDGYVYYDPWEKRAAMFRHLVRVKSERQALGFAQKWGALGEPQPEAEAAPSADSPHAGCTGTALVKREAVDEDSWALGEPVRYLPPRGRLSRWQPQWPQPVAAYLKQAAALQQVSVAIVGLGQGRDIKTRALRVAIEQSGVLPVRLPTAANIALSGPLGTDRPLGAIDLINLYFRWAGTEGRSFLILNEAGQLSLAHEYRCLVAPAALGLLETAGLGKLRRCHYPECPRLSTLNHCCKHHERSCPLKAEHRVRAAALSSVSTNPNHRRQ